MSTKFRAFSLLAAVGIFITLFTVKSPPANAVGPQILNCRFGPAQVFDTQWYISNSVLNVSGITWPYYGPGNQLDSLSFTANDYLQFIQGADPNNPGTYGLKIVRSDSTEEILNTWGEFVAIGDDFIFYNGEGGWGTLFTTSRGYSHGESAALPIDIQNPTMTEVDAFTSCSANVAAAGQAVVSSSPTPTPTPTGTTSPATTPAVATSVESTETATVKEKTLARTGVTDSPMLALALILMFFGYTAYSIGFEEMRKAKVLKWLGLDWLDFKFK